MTRPLLALAAAGAALALALPAPAASPRPPKEIVDSVKAAQIGRAHV